MMCMHARSNNWMSQNVDKLNSSGNLKGTGGPPSFLTFPDMDRQRHLALAREPLTILFALNILSTTTCKQVFPSPAFLAAT